jgi:hypothetical protein
VTEREQDGRLPKCACGLKVVERRPLKWWQGVWNRREGVLPGRGEERNERRNSLNEPLVAETSRRDCS